MTAQTHHDDSFDEPYEWVQNLVETPIISEILIHLGQSCVIVVQHYEETRKGEEKHIIASLQ